MVYDTETTNKPHWTKILYIGALCYTFLCVGVGVYTQYAVHKGTVQEQVSEQISEQMFEQMHVYTCIQRNEKGCISLLNVPTVDGKSYENVHVKIARYIDNTETQTPAEYVRQYLIERQKADAQMENVTVYTEKISDTACVGYYKYYGQAISGNAEYVVPVLTIVYAENTLDGVLKHTFTTYNKQYDADFVENAVTDFLYCNGIAGKTSLTAFDLLSVTDITGTYIPKVQFAYTDAKYFEFDSTTGTIKEYRINDKGAPTDVYVPETIGGVVVRNIGDKAFYKYKETETELCTVTLPSTVTTIGAYAFSGCSELTNIQLSTNLTAIGEYALSGCTSLTSIDLPESLIALPAGCFYGDTALETVNGVVQSYAATTFSRCDNLTQLPEITDVVR